MSALGSKSGAVLFSGVLSGLTIAAIPTVYYIASVVVIGVVAGGDAGSVFGSLLAVLLITACLVAPLAACLGLVGSVLCLPAALLLMPRGAQRRSGVALTLHGLASGLVTALAIIAVHLLGVLMRGNDPLALDMNAGLPALVLTFAVAGGIAGAWYGIIERRSKQRMA